METPPDLPPTDMHLQALGHLARALEERLPGLLTEWVDGLQDEALLSEIVRLRGPREAPQIKRERAAALVWAKHVRLVALAESKNVTPPHPARGRRPG